MPAQFDADPVFALFFEAGDPAAIGCEPYRTLVSQLVEAWIDWASEFVGGPLVAEPKPRLRSPSSTAGSYLRQLAGQRKPTAPRSVSGFSGLVDQADVSGALFGTAETREYVCRVDPMAGEQDGELAELGEALRRLAPVDVSVGVRRIDHRDLAEMFDVERSAVERAVPRRQNEFASGRVLLRGLLGTDSPIPVRADRAPMLPAGVVGSLAHDRDFVVAAISTDLRVRSLGIDIEPMDPLASDMQRVILRDDETGIDAHLAFSLKEAVYKAWSSLGGPILDHHDVLLQLGPETFAAEVHRPLTAGSDSDVTSFNGSFTRVRNRCLALLIVNNRN